MTGPGLSPDYARRLFAFNTWANGHIIEAVRGLSSEDLHRDLRTSFTSVHGTLVHLVSGEWRWLQFWLDEPYEREFSRDEFPDVAAIEKLWTKIAGDQRALAASLTPERLRETKVVRGLERPLADTMQHLLNHSSYHRGQIASLLRQTGHQPPPIDFLIFAAAE
ncbi:MAG TPA: DinB family protein [Gemmatimonadaceae bacterium]|nr:DinB family protein [Gemmatimonadaceae bacterium]